LQELIRAAEARTAHNDSLHLTIAANYGGRWDILQAMKRLLKEQPALAQNPEEIDEAALTPYLSMAFAPEPDMSFRNAGDQRTSHFPVWRTAYTGLYSTERYSPDFSTHDTDAAFEWYRTRDRRFGRTSAPFKSGTCPMPLGKERSPC